jgi:hypothetical protein
VTRWFNTAGPCLPDLHYMLPPLSRLPAAAGLIKQSGYFVVHAPRQTGKTTALLALATELTASGQFAALYLSCEAAEATGDDYGAAARSILDTIRLEADSQLSLELLPPIWPSAPEANLLRAALTAWSHFCPRPLVLFFDEIDALRGDSLISVLRQLRSGYINRPAHFPSSVVLCGLRDVRDYKAASGGDPGRLGTSSPFNIKVESLRLGDFTPDEVRELYGQYTTATGRPFGPGVLERVIELTAGQPWLVNALAREIVEKIAPAADEPITVEHVERAKEKLILARATHLDSLAARLAEPRVRRILEPALAGTLLADDPTNPYDDDLQYVRDLGLIAVTRPVRIANPIYREVLARVLAATVEENVTAEPRAFVGADGTLDLPGLLREFAGFWRENGEILAAGQIYHEAAPQLVLMGFLQRLINGGGFVEREYGIGRGRIDLHIRWPYVGRDGEHRWQREAIELKVWRPGRPDPLRDGLVQLDGYLARLGLDAGTLVLFDRRPEAAPIEERTAFSTVTSPAGRAVTVLRA